MKILAKNKKAYFDYEILEKLEAGIVLAGHEVKSIKSGNVSLKGSYVAVTGGEVWLLGCHISPYKFARLEGYEPTRTRKLLLSKKQIASLIGKTKAQGLTLIPLSMYVKRGFVKLEIALAKGKKKYEKRETIKKREAKRKIGRAIRKAV